MFWLYVKPEEIGLNFTENIASMGPDYASLGLDTRQNTDRRLEQNILSMPSGQSNNMTIKYEIIDGYEQRVTFDNSTTC